MKFNQITILIIASCTSFGIAFRSEAQISGPTSATLNTTHTYSYSSSTVLGFGNWQPTGGTVMNSWESLGGSGGTYYADIKWTSAGDNRNLIFANYSETIASLAVDVCSSGQAASVSILDPGTICVGSNVTLTATPTNGGYTPFYVWKVNNVVKQSSGSNSYSTTTLANNDVVSVTLTSSISCVSAAPPASRTISGINPTPVSVTINDPGTVCQGTTITFTASPTNGGTNPTYTWYRNGYWAEGNVHPTNGNQYSPDASHPFLDDETMHVEITSNSTCYTGSLTKPSDPVTISLQSNVQPTVNIIGQSAICEGTGQTYTASSQQTITSYSWSYDAGDQGLRTSSSSSFPLSAADLQWPGNTIQLTVGVSGNCLDPNWASTNLPLTIYDPPQVGTLSAGSSMFCSSGSVTLTLTYHTGNNSWKYRYKDGVNGTYTSYSQFSVSSANSVDFTSLTCGASLPRYYEFITEVSNGTCPVAQSNPVTVTVYPPPSVGTLSATNGPGFCSSGTVNLSLTSYVGTLDWQFQQRDQGGSWSQWTNFSYASSSTNTFDISNNGSTPREYRFWVTALHGTCTGATSNILDGITSVPFPSAPSPSSGGRTEAGTVTIYGLDPANSTTCKWYDSPSAPDPLSTSDNYSPFLSVTTTYWVSGYNEAAFCEGPRTSVVAHIYPAAPVVSPTSGVVDIGEPQTLSVSNGPYATYKWWLEGNIVGARSTFDVTIPGAYRVEGTKTGMSGSTFSAYVTIERGFDDQAPRHYVMVNRIKAETVTNASQVEGLPAEVRSRTVKYLGGLGNTLQVISSSSSPLKKDVVQTAKYDALGRQLVQYMPYVSSADDSKFQDHALDNTGYTNSDQYTFYQQTGMKRAIDTKPYSTTEVESSPLQRVTAQTGVGDAWHTAGKKVTKEYLLNRATDNIRLWQVVSGLPVSNAAYTDYQLYVNVTTDENGNKVKQYADKLGRIVQKDVQSDASTWLKTVYVYDDFGRLAFVLTPEGVRTLSGYSPTQAFLDSWGFQYKYDHFGRAIETKPPGAGWQYTVYDELDRVAMTQSADQRTRNEWTFIKYDVYGRKVVAGYKVIAESRATIQTNVDAQSFNYEIISADATGYTLNRTYPSALATDLLSVSYYDNYDFLSYSGWDAEVHSFSFVSELGNTETASILTGLPTGQKVRVVSSAAPSSQWLNAVQFYDAQSRPVQAISENHLGGLDRTTLKYTFRTQVSETLRTHDGYEAITVRSKTIYDHAGRITEVYENINNAPSDQLVAQYVYNELGQLVEKKLHKSEQSDARVQADPAVGQPGVAYDENIVSSGYTSSEHTYIASNSITLSPGFHATAGSTFSGRIGYSSQDAGAYNSTIQEDFLQVVDYRYNIRGWLTSINNAQLNSDGGITNDDTNDYFGMEMLYNTVESGLGNTDLHNGNISAAKWKGVGAPAGNNDRQSYKFSYDKADRLLTATSQMYSTSSWAKESGVKNENMTYDDNGNIKTLQRNQPKHQLSGIVASYVSEPIDNLTFTYKSSNGNQLDKVEDATGKPEGFSNGTTDTNEFTYNADGSVSADNNKGIDTIYYNILGKPWQIHFKDTTKLEYTYGASGQKLKMKFYQGNVVQDSIDYSGGFVYKDGTLDFFASPEGRVVKNGSNFEYQYVISDHQGNTRVLFTSATPAPDAPLANFEDPAADGQEYLNVPNALPFWASFTAANHTPDGIKVVRMNQDFNIGPARSLKVFPGDKVDMEVWTYYENNQDFGTSSPPLLSLITTIAGVFGGSSGGGGEAGAIYDGVAEGLGAAGTGGSQGDTRPGAYLNYLLFDKNYKFLNTGFTVVPTTALNSKQQISIPTVNIEHEGYIFVYLSYESESNNYVQFDDFKVTHTKSNILQYNEYYPFGLQTANSWTRENTSNRYLYNGGNELNESSGWYETFFREYDAALGRFMQVDPLASSFGSHSPYHYAYNNPMLFNDVFGAEADSTGRHSAGYSVYNFPHPYNGHTWITPGSANHWSDGIGNTDWSLYGGSEMYQTGFAAGMTDIGGKLYHINSNGTRNKLTSENGRLGYHQTNTYWNGHAAVFHEYFVEVAQQGGQDPPWVQFLKEHYYFEAKSRVTYGPQVALMPVPGGVVPGPYVRGLLGARINIGSNVLWEGTADIKNGARTTAIFGEKFTQGIAITLGAIAGEWDREVTSEGAVDSYRLVFFGILGGEINSTTRDAFIGLMPGASWTVGVGVEGTMKSGFRFKF